MYTTASQGLTYDTPLFRAGGVSAAEIGGIMAQSARALLGGPQVMQATVPSLPGSVDVLSTNPAPAPDNAPGFTLPLTPIALGAAVGYLLAHDTTGLLLGGLAGFLLKDKIA